MPLTHGISAHVLTERGSCFTGFNIFGFKCSFTPSYHPKTKSTLKRFHRYSKQRLLILADEGDLDFLSSNDWDPCLPNMAFSYNITLSVNTGYSPYNIPCDNWIKLPIDRKLIVEDISIGSNPLDYDQLIGKLEMKKIII